MNLIFDVDGTIWDSTKVVAESWNRAMKSIGFKEYEDRNYEITAEMLKKEFGKPMDVIADNLFPELNEEQREKVLDACCRFEHEDLEATTEDLAYAGVVETIKKLSEGNKLFIVSNCQSGYIELVMRKLGIEDCIMDIECYGNTLKYKAENLQLLMDRNICHCEREFFYIGDTLGDFNACIEAGVPFIFATYGFGTWDEIKAREKESGVSIYGSIDSFRELDIN